MSSNKVSGSSDASKDKLYFVSEKEFWEPIEDESLRKIGGMTAEEVYPSFNPGPTKPDGSMNFECHCVGHLVASPCGHEFRETITCQKSATEDELENGACAEQMIAFMKCAMSTECFKTSRDEEQKET